MKQSDFADSFIKLINIWEVHECARTVLGAW